MTRLTIPACVLAMVLLSALCGCSRSGQPDTSSGQVFQEPQYEWGGITGRTLTVWGRDTDLNRSYMTRAFRRYEELTGNTVRTVPFSAEELTAAAAEAFAASEGPDLLLSFGGTNLDALDPDENFYDFSGAEWVDDLTEVSINQTIYHGKIVGLPHWEASISGTLYNKEIFEQLKIEPPRTQEEFFSVCAELLENGVTPLYLPCASPTMLLYQFALDVMVEEGDTLRQINDGEKGYADLPGMKTVVEWYRTMARKGYLGTDYMENDWDGMSRALDSGDYAMMLCWDTWLYTDFEGDASRFGLLSRGTF